MKVRVRTDRIAMQGGSLTGVGGRWAGPRRRSVLGGRSPNRPIQPPRRAAGKAEQGRKSAEDGVGVANAPAGHRCTLSTMRTRTHWSAGALDRPTGGSHVVNRPSSKIELPPEGTSPTGVGRPASGRWPPMLVIRRALNASRARLCARLPALPAGTGRRAGTGGPIPSTPSPGWRSWSTSACRAHGGSSPGRRDQRRPSSRSPMNSSGGRRWPRSGWNPADQAVGRESPARDAGRCTRRPPGRAQRRRDAGLEPRWDRVTEHRRPATDRSAGSPTDGSAMDVRCQTAGAWHGRSTVPDHLAD